MNRLRIAAVFVSGILVAAAAVGVYAALDSGGNNNSSVQNVATNTPATSATTTGSNASLESADCMSAADIYAAVRPSVVEVDVSGTQGGPFGSQPFSGTGTGIVLDDQGRILTNNHVVENTSEITVKFDDGATIPATVLGADAGNDLAVIKIDPSAHELKPATLGDSSTLRVGDPALALGNPFNLEASLTQGIVSGLNRSYSEGTSDRDLRGLIQTDAPVNPGNSGGPLLDCHGNVIGINTLLDNPSGQSVNVGVAFAIAINTAKSELNSLEASQTVEHAWLGISGVDVTPTLETDLNLTANKGVYVTQVSSGGPAATAGLKPAYTSANQANTNQGNEPPTGGDVITSIDGHDMSGIEQLATYIDQNNKPGDQIKLGVIRAGQSMTITVTLVPWPTTATS